MNHVTAVTDIPIRPPDPVIVSEQQGHRSGAISVRSLTRSFDEQRAVDALNLEVRPGEIYGFLGPNGAGKTTTVRMLCTLLAPTSGTATVAGIDIVEDPGAVRLRIGVALQEAALDPKQTGAELLTLQAKLFGFSSADAHRRRLELAEVVDLGDALNRPVSTYSGGMK
ncbi:MAG: ATP-binding cassette domain-containing protein, partial [Actinobacteria bacterium]|nr:ATP-binding cassette domain-containing protein [Actinomycetota bacterium]